MGRRQEPAEVHPPTSRRRRGGSAAETPEAAEAVAEVAVGAERVPAGRRAGRAAGSSEPAPSRQELGDSEASPRAEPETLAEPDGGQRRRGTSEGSAVKSEKLRAG